MSNIDIPKPFCESGMKLISDHVSNCIECQTDFEAVLSLPIVKYLMPGKTISDVLNIMQKVPNGKTPEKNR